MTLHHRHFSAAFPKVFGNVLSWMVYFMENRIQNGWFGAALISGNRENGAKMVQENDSNMFKPFQSHSGNMWSNVKHYFLWEISSLNLCILFNPEFWSSTILQTRTQCPQLIQHNSITDKFSHTFPVSSVCSKAPPIPPLARRVCRGIGTHHHCLLAYGKKAIMLDKPIVSRISWRYSSSMIRLSIVEIRHHCSTFQPWESMRYSFFSCFCWSKFVISATFG